MSNGFPDTIQWPQRRVNPPANDESAADEGGTFREPAPARVPPRVPRQREFDGWPLLGLALLFGLGVPFLIAVGSELIQFVRMVLP